MKALTQGQIKRVFSEIKNTEAKLNRELAYSKDLQHENRILEMKNHILHLNNMLKVGWDAPVFD